jgi:serine/threonine protein phosphatase 1
VRLTQIGEKLKEHVAILARAGAAVQCSPRLPLSPGVVSMSVVVERRGFSLPLGVSPQAEVFAIGDIHGRSDLLAALIDEAAREPKLRDKRAIVFLGDLIDRGPDSLGAIDLAMAAKARVGADEAIALMGNHETIMRLTLDPESPWDDAIDAFDLWLGNGGDRTVAEFLKTEAPLESLDDTLTRARASLPPRVLAWLTTLRPSWRSGQILFVHAGVNPEVELEAFLAAPWNTPLAKLDEDRHWAWVRRPFLDHRPGAEGFSGFFVVHGHTPNDGRRKASHADQIAGYRLNLDAGSAMTGIAKMAIIRDRDAEVVSARG